MTDPWEALRLRMSDDWKGLRHEEPHYNLDNLIKPLLADADALLAVVPFAAHKRECQIARAWGNGPGGTFTDPHCNCGYEKALAALPEHLGEEA